MSNIIIWEKEKDDKSGDLVQLVFNDRVGKYGILISDAGRGQVVSFTEEDAAKLLHHLTSFIMNRSISQGLVNQRMDFKISERGAGREEYEKSEKDAMWERD